MTCGGIGPGGRDGLSLPQHLDFLVGVERHADRPAQRHLVLGVAAHDRVFHVEERVADGGLDAARQRDAGFREARLQRVVRLQDVRDEVRRDLDVVEVALFEGQQPRVGFLDDADVHLAHHRQLPSLQSGDDRAVGGVGAVGIAHFAEAGIRLEYDLLAAPPFLEPVRPGADRVLHRPAAAVAVRLDDVARHRRGLDRRQVGQQIVGGLRQAYLDRVPVERDQSGHRRVVVELAGFLRLDHQGIRTFEQAVECLQLRRAHLRVEHALPRIDVVGSRQLALASLERRVVVEIDAGLDAYRPLQAVGRILGQRDGRVGHDPVRTRQDVVGVERIEDRALDVGGIDVVRCLRVEAGLGDGKRDAQHLGGVGLRGCGQRDQRRTAASATTATATRITALFRCRRPSIRACRWARSAPARCPCGRPGTW